MNDQLQQLFWPTFDRYAVYCRDSPSTGLSKPWTRNVLNRLIGGNRCIMTSMQAHGKLVNHSLRIPRELYLTLYARSNTGYFRVSLWAQHLAVWIYDTENQWTHSRQWYFLFTWFMCNSFEYFPYSLIVSIRAKATIGLYKQVSQ